VKRRPTREVRARTEVEADVSAGALAGGSAESVPLTSLFSRGSRGVSGRLRVVSPGAPIAIGQRRQQEPEEHVKETNGLILRMVAALTIPSLIPSSTSAEEWTRRRTAQRAAAAAGTLLLDRSRAKRDARGRLAELVVRGVEAMIRERQRRSRSKPERWPDEPRQRRIPQQRDDFPDSLVMPVAGVRWEELRDSFGDPRSGGRRHLGIDIFARRWTEVLAVMDGSLTSIGHGARAGRSMWLVGADGRSYFYGHLEAWAEGIHEGMRVAPGEPIGYVGNSGNARGLPTHLHFEVREDGRAVNPYPVLASAEPTDVRVASRRGRSRRGG